MREVESRFGVRFKKLDLTIPYEAMVWLDREEPEDLQRLQELLKEGDTFVDIGANIGLWTLVAAQAVGATGQVLAFEPNPVTFAKLEQNIRLNGVEKRVAAHAVAIAAQAGAVEFVCRVDHNNSYLARPGETAQTTSVVAAPMSDYLSDRKVTGIKLDVEGAELAVLESSTRRRWRNRLHGSVSNSIR